jgi:hypothetical protein
MKDRQFSHDESFIFAVTNSLAENVDSFIQSRETQTKQYNEK